MHLLLSCGQTSRFLDGGWSVVILAVATQRDGEREACWFGGEDAAIGTRRLSQRDASRFDWRDTLFVIFTITAQRQVISKGVPEDTNIQILTPSASFCKI